MGSLLSLVLGMDADSTVLQELRRAPRNAVEELGWWMPAALRLVELLDLDVSIHPRVLRSAASWPAVRTLATEKAFLELVLGGEAGGESGDAVEAAIGLLGVVEKLGRNWVRNALRDGRRRMRQVEGNSECRDAWDKSLVDRGFIVKPIVEFMANLPEEAVERGIPVREFGWILRMVEQWNGKSFADVQKEQFDAIRKLVEFWTASPGRMECVHVFLVSRFVYLDVYVLPFKPMIIVVWETCYAYLVKEKGKPILILDFMDLFWRLFVLKENEIDIAKSKEFTRLCTTLSHDLIILFRSLIAAWTASKPFFTGDERTNELFELILSFFRMILSFPLQDLEKFSTIIQQQQLAVLHLFKWIMTLVDNSNSSFELKDDINSLLYCLWEFFKHPETKSEIIKRETLWKALFESPFCWENFIFFARADALETLRILDKQYDYLPFNSVAQIFDTN